MVSPHNSVGILGGTFDPIHNGHLHIAEQAKIQFALEKILFVPCKVPVLKAAAKVSEEHRLNMLKLALESTPDFDIDTRELDRETPSYMLETLQTLHEDFPQTKLFLILGQDAFAEFDRWHQHEKILPLCDILVVNRGNPTYSESVNTFVENRPQQIHSLMISEIPISSTGIREHRIDLQSAVPIDVANYIQQHQLY